MEFKTLTCADGSELNVSRVGLGCNNFGRRLDAARTQNVVAAALDAGITFFDTAENYGDGNSELYLGRALGARRKDIVVATKFGWNGNGSAAYIEKAVEISLRKLGSDYIDLYQLHKPDPRTPIAETLEALDKLVRAGKVRAIGCSNFSASQLREALDVSRERGFASFVTAQNQYSVMHRDIEAELLPLCRDEKVGILPFYPLARGMLTGKYRRGEPTPPDTRLSEGGWRAAGMLTEENFRAVERLQAYAAEHGHSVLDLAFSWLASEPAVLSVIAGATRPEQIQQNVVAADWTIGEKKRSEIDGILA